MLHIITFKRKPSLCSVFARYLQSLRSYSYEISTRTIINFSFFQINMSILDTEVTVYYFLLNPVGLSFISTSYRYKDQRSRAFC